MGGKKRKRTREGGNGLSTNEVVFTRCTWYVNTHRCVHVKLHVQYEYEFVECSVTLPVHTVPVLYLPGVVQCVVCKSGSTTEC